MDSGIDSAMDFERVLGVNFDVDFGVDFFLALYTSFSTEKSRMEFTLKFISKFIRKFTTKFTTKFTRRPEKFTGRFAEIHGSPCRNSKCFVVLYGNSWIFIVPLKKVTGRLEELLMQVSRNVKNCKAYACN